MKKIMQKILWLLFPLLLTSLSYAGYVQAWKINYSSTTERADVLLKGDFYVSTSTNTADADVIFESGGTYPVQLYDGDLQVVTTGYGITFADGTLQTTAGGASVQAISSTGTVVINSDSDTSGADPIIFRTNGATEQMRIIDTGNVGIGTTAPRAVLEITDGTTNTAGDGVRELFIVGAHQDAISTARGILTIQSNDAMAIDKGGSIAFGGRYLTSNPAGANLAQILGAKENATTNNVDGYLSFSTREQASNMNEKMRIKADGNVGIGTTVPIAVLDVEGDLQLEDANLDYDSGNYELDVSTTINLTGDLYIKDALLSYDSSNYELTISTSVKDLTISTETRYYTVSASDFVSNSENFRYKGGEEVDEDDGSGCNAWAGVHLPQGAIVTNVRLYGYRVAAGGFGATLKRKVLTSTDDDVMASCVEGAGGPDYQNIADSSISYATIDNTGYHYFIEAYTVATATIVGVVITYTITEPLP